MDLGKAASLLNSEKELDDLVDLCLSIAMAVHLGERGPCEAESAPRFFPTLPVGWIDEGIRRAVVGEFHCSRVPFEPSSTALDRNHSKQADLSECTAIVKR